MPRCECVYRHRDIYCNNNTKYTGKANIERKLKRERESEREIESERRLKSFEAKDLFLKKNKKNKPLK